MKFFKALVPLIFISAQMHATCIGNADKLADKSFLQGRDYFSRQQFLLATQQFSNAALLACPGDIEINSRLRWGQSLFELGEHEEGHRVLDPLVKSKLALTAKVMKAWYQPTLIPTLPAAEQSRFEQWLNRDFKNMDVKTPWVAGTLSAIVPGAGQFYNGNYQSGAFSFVLNAIFLATAIELSRKHMDASAVAAGMVFSVLYIGNISSSVQSAKTLNSKARQPAEEKLKQQLFPEFSF